MMCAAIVLLSAAAMDLMVIHCLLPAFGSDSTIDCDTDGSDDHDCFCCCRHVVPSEPVTLEAGAVASVVVVVPHLSVVSQDRPPIYHPPRT